MKINQRPLRLEFAPEEVAVLQALLDDLRTVLDDDADTAEAADDPVRQRLFPSAYPDDGDAEAEYRDITESSLRDDRTGRISACEVSWHSSAHVELGDPDHARRWLQVLNDLRLALGTRLGVTEEPPDIDADDPQAQSWLLYGWLTEIQDAVVHCVMR